ncbi:MAG: FadR family transcriptional regulator [Clostridia bacterium]|nr:FadR family transcriptional regulator [Clostridia bacterium]
MEENGREKRFIVAFREIHDYMMRHQLKPGDLLPSEAELSREIGVSRNVIREAIKSMELMGMVEACPGRGTEIREFSLDFIFRHALFFRMAEDESLVRQMFDIRKTLELGYMRQAFDSIPKEKIAKMREIATQMRSSWEESGAFAKEDREFHQTLFGSVGNPVLMSLLDAIWAVDTGYQLEEKLPHLASSVVKHEAIVDALEEYDYLKFAHAMYRHYSSGKYVPKNDTYEEY